MLDEGDMQMCIAGASPGQVWEPMVWMNVEVIIFLSSSEVRYLVDLLHSHGHIDPRICGQCGQCEQCGQCGLVFPSGPESAAIEWDSPEKLDCKPAQVQSSAV